MDWRIDCRSEGRWRRWWRRWRRWRRWDTHIITRRKWGGICKASCYIYTKINEPRGDVDELNKATYNILYDRMNWRVVCLRIYRHTYIHTRSRAACVILSKTLRNRYFVSVVILMMCIIRCVCMVPSLERHLCHRMMIMMVIHWTFIPPLYTLLMRQTPPQYSIAICGDDTNVFIENKTRSDETLGGVAFLSSERWLLSMEKYASM